MRKASLVVLSVLFVLAANNGLSQAQDDGAKTARLSVGISAGAAMAGCSGFEKLYDPHQWGVFVPDVEKGFRYGTSSGLFFNYRISELFSLQPEVLYSQQGCKRTVNIEINQVMGTIEGEYRGKMEATPKIEYVEIPVLFKASFNNDAVVSPYVLAGPSVGIRISAKMPYDVEYTYREFVRGVGQTLFTADTSWTRDYDLDDLVKSTRFGVVLGAGCAVELGPGVVTGELRYGQGVADVLENTGRIEVAPGEFLYFDKFKGYNLRFSVGYSVPLWR